jgi:hypothetical protein
VALVLVIAPPVRRRFTADKGVLRSCLYLAALTTGGALFAVVLSVVGQSIAGKQAVVILAPLALVMAIREIGLIRVRLPNSPYRVPREWLRLGYWRGPLLYGVAMGPGFLTSTPFASYHVFVLWILLGATPVIAGFAGALFGLVRGASIFALTGSLGVTGTSWLLSREGAVHVVNAFGLAALGVMTGLATP